MDISYKPDELKYVRNSGMEKTVFLDKEFEMRVLTHIISNSLDKKLAPCFLAIEGRMGEGKTAQTLDTCFKHGIHVYYFSGSELAGNLERDSVTKLENTYNYLQENIRENIFSVIIIDDFHLSVASCKEDTSRTVNSQLLTGFLMKIADSAKTLDGKKIPVILIANSFKHVYLPLTRDGRMDLFKWYPEPEKKRGIIKNIYKDVISNEEAIESFIKRYEEESISFFVEVKNDIYIDAINKHLTTGSYATLQEVVELFNQKFQSFSGIISSEELERYAQKRIYEYRVIKKNRRNGEKKW